MTAVKNWPILSAKYRLPLLTKANPPCSAVSLRQLSYLLQVTFFPQQNGLLCSGNAMTMPPPGYAPLFHSHLKWPPPPNQNFWLRPRLQTPCYTQWHRKYINSVRLLGSSRKKLTLNLRSQANTKLSYADNLPAEFSTAHFNFQISLSKNRNLKKNVYIKIS